MPYASTYKQQLKAMLWRNLLLKKRLKSWTIQEFVWPIYFVVILIIVKLTATPGEQDAIKSFPANNLFQPQWMPSGNQSLLVHSNGDADVERIVDYVSRELNTTPEYFTDETKMVEFYKNNSNSVFAGLMFTINTTELMFNYSIRVPYSKIPNSVPFEFVNTGSCRSKDGLYGNCNANKYLRTGFASLQATLDTAILKIFGNQSSYSQPGVSVRLFPKDTYTPDSGFIRYIASIYFVMSFMTFVSILLTMIVGEKERKIKDNMRMMGMYDSVFWAAWGIIYFIIALIIVFVVTVIAWAANFYTRSNMFIFFLLMFFYCTSVIALAFMLSTFFNKAKVAAAVGSLAPVLTSALYLPIALTKTYGVGLPTSTIHPAGQWLLCLLSPVALSLGIDWSIILDFALPDGASFGENMYVGDFPMYAPIVMLVVDTILYFTLALYFDKVIPNEFGQHRSPWFCFMPSFWGLSKVESDEEMHIRVGRSLSAKKYDQEGSRMAANIEPVPANMRNKAVISLHNIKKQFAVKEEGKKVHKNAVDGMSLDIYEGQITALLGHNGAGKTTLINMLTGLMRPTSGEATIYGLDINDGDDMTKIRHFTGVCPQQNVLLEELTCYEHLYVYANLAGVPPESIEKAIDQVLEDVDLTDKKDTLSKNLSGGQKRKLSVAMALIGDPKVMILDEPTAGMDPYSRRHLWSLLKKRRQGRVILLTTHFMDEADVLADRKAVISKGQLRCVGSSLFLKNRFGLGYHLNMVIDPICNKAEVENLVNQYVPTAGEPRHHGMELAFTLPHKDVDKFPGLFAELEATHSDATKAQNMGINSYGVSMTTLEEVFLLLEEQEEDKNGDYSKKKDTGITNPNFTPNESHRGSLTIDMEQRRTENEMTRVAFQPAPLNTRHSVASLDKPVNLTRQKFWALVKIRALIAIRSPATIFFRLCFPVILMLIALILNKFVWADTVTTVNNQPTVYYLQPYIYTQTFNGNTSWKAPPLLFHSSADFENSTPPYYFIPNYPSLKFGLYTQGFSVMETFVNRSGDYLLSQAPHHIGYDYDQYSVNTSTVPNQLTDTNFTMWYNDSAIHSLPVGLNMISNAILRSSVSWPNVSDLKDVPIWMNKINVSSYPWPETTSSLSFSFGAFFVVMLCGMAFTVVPPGLGGDVVKDREVKARSQLRTSGVTNDMYWASTIFFDCVQVYAVMICFIILILCFQVEMFFNGGAMLCLVLLCLFYGFVNMLVMINLSFLFDKADTSLSVLPTLSFFVGLFPYILVGMMSSFPEVANIAFILHTIFSIIDPLYAGYGGLNYIARVQREYALVNGLDSAVPVSAYFDINAGIIIALIMPPIHCVWNYFLLRYLDIRNTGGDPRDVCMCSVSKQHDSRVSPENDDISSSEDIDVKNERERVKLLQTSSTSEEAVIKALNLRKEFPADKSSKKKSKVNTAVKNVSFAVKPGEVFGLLGPNGAGKTSTLNMIIAETGPTKGQVSVCEYDVHSCMSKAFSLMGYCPQHDALWENITPTEHIECYAALRGTPVSETTATANYYMKNLRIEEHKNKQSKNLSGGTKRKLSYALSMLGDPKIVLLDEPSTGMDPKSKRFLWDTISNSFEGSDRGAILTTHYMEEADALCNRISIMVNGRMECIGTSQHLKNKYGSGYILEVKVKGSDDQSNEVNQTMSKLQEYISELFPAAEIVEHFSDWTMFKIPQHQVQSLGLTFKGLENGKQQFNIEEYSFSQSTLEQVFLQFAKLQADAEEDDENADLRRQTSIVRSNSSTSQEVQATINVPTSTNL